MRFAPKRRLTERRSTDAPSESIRQNVQTPNVPFFIAANAQIAAQTTVKAINRPGICAKTMHQTTAMQTIMHLRAMLLPTIPTNADRMKNAIMRRLLIIMPNKSRQNRAVPTAKKIAKATAIAAKTTIIGNKYIQTRTWHVAPQHINAAERGKTAGSAIGIRKFCDRSADCKQRRMS